MNGEYPLDEYSLEELADLARDEGPLLIEWDPFREEATVRLVEEDYADPNYEEEEYEED